MATAAKSGIVLGGLRTAGAVRIVATAEQLERLRDDLRDVKNGVPRAMVAAENKTASKGKTIVVDGIFETLNIQDRGEIRKRVHVTRATMSKPTAVIHVTRSRMNLAKFGARDTTRRRHHTGQGVFVTVYRGGGEQQMPRAFIASYRGKKTVLQRKDQLRLVETGVTTWYGGIVRRAQRVRGELVPRLPIIPLVGPSPMEVLEERQDVQSKVVRLIEVDFGEQLLSQTDRLLNRRKADRPV